MGHCADVIESSPLPPPRWSDCQVQPIRCHPAPTAQQPTYTADCVTYTACSTTRSPIDQWLMTSPACPRRLTADHSPFPDPEPYFCRNPGPSIPPPPGTGTGHPILPQCYAQVQAGSAGVRVICFMLIFDGTFLRPAAFLCASHRVGFLPLPLCPRRCYPHAPLNSRPTMRETGGRGDCHHRTVPAPIKETMHLHRAFLPGVRGGFLGLSESSTLSSIPALWMLIISHCHFCVPQGSSSTAPASASAFTGWAL